jgi:hypothetical protein
MSEPIEAMIDLVKFHNVTKINELPGAWVQKVDDSWIVAANGQREEIEVKPDGTMGCKLQPFEFAIWHNGKWWVGNTASFTCPDCKGLGYIEAVR